MKHRVTVLTHSPSPYQVELFDTVAGRHDIELRVVYLFRADPARSWSRRAPAHEHCFVSGNDGTPISQDPTLNSWEQSAELVVMNWYRHPLAAQWIRRRAVSRKPWAFWGERPGFTHPRLSRLARRWALRSLHHSRAPIWGIGEFALAEYRNEYGPGRQYVNLPYFSDLSRFSDNSLGRNCDDQRIVLFSGALTPRKGVDLLAHTFKKVATRHPNLRLWLLGSGPLEYDIRKILAPLQSRVSFLGFRDWDELPDVYSRACALCVPSRYDGWGLVVPEGLASGLPVIATDRMGAALDLLKQGQNGWLIPADDKSALMAVLERVSSLSSQALAKMGNAARESLEAHGLDDGAQRFLAACNEAIAQWS